MNPSPAAFPAPCRTIGQRIEYLSRVLLPARRFDDYGQLMATLLDEQIHYVDPVHELRGRQGVVAMLLKYLPRVANDQFRFELLVDGETRVVWKWTIVLKIRFTPFQMAINGLVHAEARDGKIVYQREYYDPMESIGVIPLVGWLYKLVLKMG